MSVPEHLAHRPTYQGLPVPWVAVWSAEQDLRPQVRLAGTLGLVGGAYVANRYGMAWLELGNHHQGVGVPDFGKTSSGRQRRCVQPRSTRCQVCGGFIEGTPWWLLPDNVEEIDPLPGEDQGYVWTKQPACCQLCAETAPLWCPHLARHGYEAIQATPTPVAALGDIHGLQVVEAVMVSLADPDRVFVLGRELVVRLDKC